MPWRVTLANAPSNTLYGYDPIALLAGDDSDLSTKAQPVYAANQLIMALSNVTGAAAAYIGPQALSTAQTSIQNVLNSSGLSATASLTWSDTDGLKSDGHRAFMNGLGQHLTQHRPNKEAFRLDVGSVTLTDYIDGTHH